MPDFEDRREYLKMERFLQTFVKEIAVILEDYGFALVERKKEGSRIKLIAETEGKRMELSFEVRE